jgi:transposase
MMTPDTTHEALPTKESVTLRASKQELCAIIEAQALRIEQSEAANQAHETTIKHLSEQNQAQEIIIKLLREKVDLLVRKIFGKSSEALDDKQLLLLLQGADGAKKGQASEADVTALEAEIANNDKATQSSKKLRKEREVRVPDNLPVGETITLLPDEVKANPEAYRHVNDEVTVQLDYAPGRFTKRLIIRPSRAERDSQPQAAA